MNTDSLVATEAASAAVAKTANRVTLADIEANIAQETYHTHVMTDGGILTICIIEVRNGFSVVGTAAPADKANFNADLGRQFARENAFRQLWPLMGYALREKMASA